MLKDNPDVEHWSTYVGQGAIRFVLSFDVQPANPYFGQMVVVARDVEARDRLKAKFEAAFRKDYVGNRCLCEISGAWTAGQPSRAIPHFGA